MSTPHRRSQERPRPVPAADEVLLRVLAAGVVPAGRAARPGAAPPKGKSPNGQPPKAEPPYGEPPFTPGLDVSGVVAAAGADVTRFGPGDEVFGRIDDGGCAGHVTVPAGRLAPKPATLDHVHAAGAPTAALTAWQALIDVGRVGPGTRVLIHAADGGAGDMAVQLARAEGAYVVATARADRHGLVRDLGADELLDPATADLAAVVHDIDVALDLVGGADGPRALGTLRPNGLLVCAVPGDPGLAPEDVEARGMRFAVVRAEPSGERLAKAAGLLADGRLRVHVAAVLPFTEAAKARELCEAGGAGGAVVLVPGRP
ncbi:NADP-dependent oxidoreductase [Streptomyces sp. NPDC000987]|uniref:NADP-dependent oxidoreductase n=1 Tax=Streptomyces sp. NPDC000987 TaxID=3154374 RepID=UPI0033329A3C